MKRIGLLLGITCICMQLSAQPISRFWSFDEAIAATDTVKNVKFIPGIKGNAAKFDGYTSDWLVPGITQTPDNLFIEAWVAPQEYSFNLSAIVDQERAFEEGFFFGINQDGQLVGALSAGGKWQTCVTKEALPQAKWTHVAFAFNPSSGLRLFLNGTCIASQAIEGALNWNPNLPLSIGKTQTKQTPTYTEGPSSKTVKSWMRFSGLIDELRISSDIPDEKQLAKEIQKAGKAGEQALPIPQMPSADIPQGPFGAYYTRLRYTDGWEALWKTGEYPDIVVRFPDSPVKYIFWRGTGYIPAIVSENNIWMTDQSLEDYGWGQCFEAMGDKQCRYSHVRIIESTPARCIIHWRYALAGIHNQIMHEDETGWGDWTDEYWTIYPDGVGIRQQVLHSDYFDKDVYQFQETILFNQPGTKPQDNLEMEAIQFADMDGKTASYTWEHGAPDNFPEPRHQPIQLINIKAQYRPFSIFQPERFTKPFKFGWVEGYSTFPCWNHWPVSQIKSDGRNATSPDKPSHTSLTEISGKDQLVERGENNTIIARQMIGMTTGPISSLLPLARSWNYPPAIRVSGNGFDYKGYNVYQRAYQLSRNETGDNASPLDLTVDANEASPIQNLALEITGWNNPDAPAVSMDGKPLVIGNGYQWGYIPGLASNKLVIWIPLASTQPVNIHIQ